MKSAAKILACAAVLLAGQDAAANPKTDYAYERVVTEFVIPGYKSLAWRAEAHAAAWNGFCASPGGKSFEDTRVSFHALADAWAGIEIVRMGPASEDFRREKFYYWPERKNAVERALAAILKSRSAKDLEPREMRKASAAVQGLPALERLLFDGVADDADFKAKDAGGFRCKLGAAIAANAAILAEEMRDGWAADAVSVSEDGKTSLATDIVTAYAVIRDTKIETVIGKEPAASKPRAAEFWRSGRSLRDIAANLEALGKLNAILFDGLPEDTSLPSATSTALKIAKSLSGDLGGIARPDALLLLDAADSAENIALAEVPAALGVTIGFNSLDGD